jgi:hypothetical protein
LDQVWCLKDKECVAGVQGNFELAACPQERSELGIVSWQCQFWDLEFDILGEKTDYKGHATE